MELEFVIFCCGVAGSFGPFYYALKYLDRRLGNASSSSAPRDEVIIGQRHEFLLLLRREAAIRASSVLDDAVRQVRNVLPLNQQLQLSEDMIRRLEETGKLVVCLLPKEARLAYQRAAQLLMQPSVDSAALETNKIHEEIAALGVVTERVHQKLNVLHATSTIGAASNIPSQAAGLNDLSRRGPSYEKSRAKAGQIDASNRSAASSNA